MDLEVYRKEDRELNFTINDEAGDPVDLTDATVTFVVTNQLGGDTQIIDVNATNLGSDGTCKVTLTDTQTNITPKTYWFEIWVTLTTGLIYSAEVGNFFVRKRGEL